MVLLLGGQRVGRSDAVGDCGVVLFFFQAEDGIRDYKVTGVQTCALPILEVVVVEPLRADRQIVVAVVAALLGCQLREQFVEVFDKAALVLVDDDRAGRVRGRSEEGRVGEEGRSRGGPDYLKKKNRSASGR